MASIYGELIRAQLHLSAADLTPVASGLIYLNTTSHQVKWYANAAWKIAADLDTAQTLTNKTLTAAVLNSYSDLTESAAPATPGAGFMRLYAKNDQKLYTKDSNGVENEVGSGSGGSGEKNYITNPSADSAITGWTAVTVGAALAVSRTTEVLDVNGLPRQYTTGTGIKIFNVTGDPTGSYVYFDFTLDDIDLNKKLKIQWSQKRFGSYAASDFEVYIAAAASRGTILHTPDVTNIGAFDDDFTATFDTGSTTALSLVIRAKVNTADASGLIISDVVVGPGTIIAAAPIGYMGTFTPNITGVTYTVEKAVYYRRGDNVKMDVEVVATGNATTTVAFLPNSSISGLTLDTSKVGLRAALGSARLVATTNSYTMTPHWDSPEVKFTLYAETTGLNATLPTADAGFDTGDRLSFSIEFPVAEWACAPNYAGQNDVEYAYGTGVWDSDDTTTGYGPQGATIAGGLATVARTKDINWQTPVQVTDVIEVQFSHDRTKWFSSDGYTALVLGTAGAIDSGSGIRINTSSGSTATSVTFARYRLLAHDGTISNWVASTYYRFVKHRAGAAVGFGLADTTRSGLIGTGTQSFAGNKTFTGNVALGGLRVGIATESGGAGTYTPDVTNYGAYVFDGTGAKTVNTINGGVDGKVLFIIQQSNAGNSLLLTNAGNIRTASGATVTIVNNGGMTLVYQNGGWQEIASGV